MTTAAQLLARETFDLDSAMAALPPRGPSSANAATHRGAAGVRLRGHLTADIADPLLREFARDTLGAKRCSEQYLDALRVILGNQADAERHGYVLEMNQRASFASPKVMRQIIDQMRRARITFGSVVVLGGGRSQEVQCYWRVPKTLADSTPREVAAESLELLYRATEAADDARREKANHYRACENTGWHFPERSGMSIADAGVPY